MDIIHDIQIRSTDIQIRNTNNPARNTNFSNNGVRILYQKFVLLRNFGVLLKLKIKKQ